MRRSVKSIPIVVGLLAFSVPLLAHHGGASYANGTSVTVKGTVTEYLWSNPHVLLHIDVKDDSGKTVNWIVEAWNPLTQRGAGWTKDTFKPGDEVEVATVPAKNGQPSGRFIGRIVINGKVFKP